MPREIGWSQESNLLYQIKQLLSRASGGGGSSTPLIETYATYSAFPAVGTAGVFYVDSSFGNQYVWDGSRYVVLQETNPIFPYPVMVTTGTAAMPVRLRNVYAIEYYRGFFSYPIINKQYPNPNDNLTKIYGFVDTTGGKPVNFSVSHIGIGGNVTLSGVEVLMADYIGNGNFQGNVNFNLASITQLSFPDLVYLITGTISFGVTSPSWNLSVPLLKFWSGGFAIPTGLLNPSFPKLEVVDFIQNLTIAVASYDLPELLYIGFFQDTSNTSTFTTLNFPKLKVIGLTSSTGLNLTGTKANLTTINLPSIEIIGGLTFPTTAPNLVNFTFGPNLKCYTAQTGTTVQDFLLFTGALNQASVDNILIRLAALDGTNGTTIFQNRVVTIGGASATPSAAGLAAKVTLGGRGCSVNTN